MEYTPEQKYDLIKQDVLKCGDTDPIAIARAVMNEDFVGMHGPEHHFLDGAAFLMAYHNAGGKIISDACLDELARRTIKMPGAMCGYWGVCGSVASVGAALSIIHGTGPLSTDAYYADNMRLTSAILAKMAQIGGARCCKRNAFLALSAGVAFVKERYGIPMEADKPVCGYYLKNAQCLGKKCPYHPHSSDCPNTY